MKDSDDQSKVKITSHIKISDKTSNRTLLDKSLNTQPEKILKAKTDE